MMGKLVNNMANMIELDTIPEKISDARHVPKDDVFPGQTYREINREKRKMIVARVTSLYR